MGGRGGDAGCVGENSKHGFTDAQLNRKYDKHGKEFGNISKDEYSSLAIKLRDSIETETLEQFTTAAGNTFKYNKNTNEFLIHKSNGEITTFFRPTDSYKYWIRQREKYEFE
jgi:pyocin large subunit-like protein